MTSLKISLYCILNCSFKLLTILHIVFWFCSDLNLHSINCTVIFFIFTMDITLPVLQIISQLILHFVRNLSSFIIFIVIFHICRLFFMYVAFDIVQSRKMCTLYFWVFYIIHKSSCFTLCTGHYTNCIPTKALCRN